VIRQSADERLVQARPAAVSRDEQQEGARPFDQAQHQGEVERLEVLRQVWIDRRAGGPGGRGFLV